MYRELTEREASYNYSLGTTIIIGEKPEEGWSVNKSMGNKPLSYHVERYKQYYDGEIKFFANFIRNNIYTYSTNEGLK
jgi:hypothetical protein